jgi:hypothetical protein
MTKQNKKWLAIPIIVGAIALYLRAHPTVPPKPASVTLEQGSPIAVRLERTVGSKTSTSGEQFTAKLAQPIAFNGKTIVPAGTEFVGTVLQASPAGTLAGGATLRIALTSFSFDDKDYSLQTTPLVRVTQGKGKRTAEVTGGAAALGAAIGALAHGRKGALIGAAAGAGAGAIGSAATNKPVDVVIPRESLLTFRLTEAVVITPKPAPKPPHSDLASVIRGWFS